MLVKFWDDAGMRLKQKFKMAVAAMLNLRK